MTPLYYKSAKEKFGETQTAILRTYHTGGFTEDQAVEISAEHDFSGSPYQDTVGFVVGSNQTIFSMEEMTRDFSKKTGCLSM